MAKNVTYVQLQSWTTMSTKWQYNGSLKLVMMIVTWDIAKGKTVFTMYSRTSITPSEVWLFFKSENMVSKMENMACSRSGRFCFCNNKFTTSNVHKLSFNDSFLFRDLQQVIYHSYKQFGCWVQCILIGIYIWFGNRITWAPFTYLGIGIEKITDHKLPQEPMIITIVCHYQHIPIMGHNFQA